MESTIAGVIFFFFGLIGLAAGVFDWRVMTEPARNYSFIRALGPNGTRVFYIVLGIFMLGVGLAFLTGTLRFGVNR